MAVDPMTMLSIGQSVLGFIDANNKAKQQEQAYRQNRIAAATARDMKIQALNARAIQESERVAGAKLENAIKALEVSEAKVVAAGEAGVAGQGVQAQIDMTEARRLRGNTIYSQQLDGILQQMDFEKQGINAEALNRINSMQRGQPPSFLRAAVGAASSAYATELKYAGNQQGSFLAGIGLGGSTAPYQSQPLPPVVQITR